MTKKQQIVKQWVLFLKYGNEWKQEILIPETSNRLVDVKWNGNKLNTVALKYIDPQGNESPAEIRKMN
jgi:hypothetical protein